MDNSTEVVKSQRKNNGMSMNPFVWISAAFRSIRNLLHNPFTWFVVALSTVFGVWNSYFSFSFYHWVKSLFLRIFDSTHVSDLNGLWSTSPQEVLIVGVALIALIGICLTFIVLYVKSGHFTKLPRVVGFAMVGLIGVMITAQQLGLIPMTPYQGVELIIMVVLFVFTLAVFVYTFSEAMAGLREEGAFWVILGLIVVSVLLFFSGEQLNFGPELTMLNVVRVAQFAFVIILGFGFNAVRMQRATSGRIGTRKASDGVTIEGVEEDAIGGFLGDPEDDDHDDNDLSDH